MVRDSETFTMTFRWTVNVLQGPETNAIVYHWFSSETFFFPPGVMSSLDLNVWDIQRFARHPFWIEKQNPWKLHPPTSIAEGPFKGIIRILIIWKEPLDLFSLIIWYFISNTLSSHLPDWDVWEVGIKKKWGVYLSPDPSDWSCLQSPTGPGGKHCDPITFLNTCVRVRVQRALVFQGKMCIFELQITRPPCWTDKVVMKA